MLNRTQYQNKYVTHHSEQICTYIDLFNTKEVYGMVLWYGVIDDTIEVYGVKEVYGTQHRCEFFRCNSARWHMVGPQARTLSPNEATTEIELTSWLNI